MSNLLPRTDSFGIVFGLLALAMSGSAPAEEWSTVTCPPADLPPEAMFDVAEQVDRFDATDLRWEPALGGQNARCTLHHDNIERRSGTGSMRVQYSFGGVRDLEYVQLKMPLEIPRGELAFGFWLKQEEEFPVRLRICDKSGETHQFDLISSKSSEWQFVAALLNGPSSSWGGDENRRCDFPCRLEGILLDRPQRGFQGKGAVWIDDVSLLRRRASQRTLRVSTRGARFGNLYAVGEVVQLRMAGTGDRIQWKWEDFWGNVLAKGEGSGDAVAQFELPRPGYYSCRIEFYADGRLAEVERFCCAALTNGKETGRSDFVGVCSHYGQNNYPLPSMDLMRDYGIDQFRDEISWRSFERQRGTYELPIHAKAYLAHAAQLRMRPLIIYDYSNPFYDEDGFPNSPEAIAAFANYAVNLTRQTQGTVSMFEVWNEWIGGCGMQGRPGDHGPKAYGRLQMATHAAVKGAFPGVTVVGIGGEYGAECTENVVAALQVAGVNSMDAWSIHPYRYPRSPEESELAKEVNNIADHVRRTGAVQKAWITEIGWPTHRTSRGSTEAMQARYCVRTLALLQSTGTVEKVFWYDFKDDGTRRDYNEHNFGLVRHQTYHCAPKPGVVAMSVFVRMTGKATFQKLQSTGARYTARYQRHNGSDLLIAWSAEDARRVKIAGQVERIVDLMGADRRIADVDQVTSDPVYIVGKSLKIEPQLGK